MLVNVATWEGGEGEGVNQSRGDESFTMLERSNEDQSVGCIAINDIHIDLRL